jgi:putative Mg2+ transporter-C (MgtC) family protein
MFDYPNQQFEALFLIALAAILAAVPGLDREKRHRPAGLRTHMMVAISTSAITITARLIFPVDSAARIVANVLTGIGFLGAGVIIQRKRYVHDITTAASIWLVAMVGIIVGYKLYILAVGLTILITFVLSFLRRFEDKSVPNPTEEYAKKHSEEDDPSPDDEN